MTDVQQQQEIIKEFFDAIQQGEYETVEELLVELITSGIDINTQDEDGNTALHKAVSYNNNGKFCNNDEIVELLVKNGAKIDVLNARGQTAIDIARDFNNDTIVEFLAYILKNQQQEIIERINELANENNILQSENKKLINEKKNLMEKLEKMKFIKKKKNEDLETKKLQLLLQRKEIEINNLKQRMMLNKESEIKTLDDKIDELNNNNKKSAKIIEL